MYHDHWGLRLTPFPGRLDTSGFFRSSVHDEALARLHFLVDQRRRLGIVAGAPGTGKSMLLAAFGEELERRGRPVVKLNLLGVTAEELPWLLATELGLHPAIDATHVSLWRGIRDRILENRYQQLGTTVLLDDVDAAEPSVPDVICRLAHSDLSPSADLTIVVACDDRSVDRLGRRLLELADLRVDLVGWDEEDTAEFVVASLARAGRHSVVFDPQALARLYELSGGVPRRVSQLADLSLVAGAGMELTQIDAATVDMVDEELNVGTPQLAPTAR